MRGWAASILCLMVAACATAPVTPPSDAMFYDRAFRAPSEPIRASDVLAVSKEMEQFLAVDIKAKLDNMGAREGLIDAIYSKGQLKIEYDSATTRNAAQAFAARSGNCLSLVIMTAAFAKALNLPVQFQSVSVEETFNRVDDIYFFIGHINVTLGSTRVTTGFTHRSTDLAHRRFSLPGGDAGTAHPAHLREHRHRDVHEQSRRRGVCPGRARRRVLVGARRYRAGPAVPERL